MSKTFTPITILLIEDNPAQEGIKAKDLKSRGIDIGDLDDNTDVPGINFKKEGNKELHNLFTLKVLQHPEEIKEFISNSLEKEDKEGSVALGDIAGIVPEIVEFDYKLYDNIIINSESDEKGEEKKHIKYWSSFQKLREHYNPNFLFNGEQHLEKKENENYTVKDFIERINKEQNTTGNEVWYKLDEKQLKEDDLGLYAGVEITRLFRNHVSIGIPATSNKENIKNLHTFSKFYEWMNDYDLGTMFSREERGNKDWDSVIAAAVKQLRIRIETQLQSNKITLNLTQLLEYANEIPTEKDKRLFTFQSAYGVRHLPLDGLFIDVEADKRDAAIVEWIKGRENEPEKPGLLGTITSSLPVLKDTIKIYESIYDTYKTKFLNRILLSDFSKREKGNNLGSYAELYNKLKSSFGVINGKIGDDSLCSVTQVFANKKNGKNSNWSEDDKSKLRLLVLLLCTRLYINHQKGAKNKADEIPLIKEDYFYILNPVMNTTKGDNPLLLCMHSDISESDYTDSFGKWLMDSSVNLIPRADWHKFEWVSSGEKRIAEALFQPELSNLTKRPDWLS